MYVIFTSSFLVLFVHRTTYKKTNSYLLIEKSILQFDHLTPMEEVSWICIPKHNFIQIRSHAPYHHKSWGSHYFSIGIASITNFKTFCYFVIIAVVDVTG
jgi:hypothetical protein